jgi:glycolate oxidase
MMTWDTIDEIKSMWGDKPLMLKGIATAEDAALAVQHGVDVVWVSNHGGRQLDHGMGTLDNLPEVIEAVDGKAEVVVDGGIQRGTDVVKALALGARAVAIGKLQCWGMAAAGVDGIVRVLEILEAEIHSCMGLLGVSSLDQLNGNYIRKAEPVTWPHEMSSWPNISNREGNAAPDGRIL